jgi:hypothetical protein
MSALFDCPLKDRLAGSSTILLAGAGGGFDVYAALPLYFALQALGKTVYLANLSFSTIYASNGKRLGPALVQVDARTTYQTRYFPEILLAQWFHTERNEEISVFCLDRTGAAPVIQGYAALCERLKPDALVLVDGGTDTLMRGDEPGLGTPQEDAVSLAAAQAVDVPTKLLVCIGFGIDTHHGVCHAYFLEAVAELSRGGAFLGAWSVLPDMPEGAAYRSAVEFATNAMFNHPSIVNTSIVAAMDGRFGDYHPTFRTEGSELFINPLMALYWSFELNAVAERNLYLSEIRSTESYSDLSLAIERFRAVHQAVERPWKHLPF